MRMEPLYGSVLRLNNYVFKLNYRLRKMIRVEWDVSLLLHGKSFSFGVDWIFGMANNFDVDILQLVVLRPVIFPETLEIFFELKEVFPVERRWYVPDVLTLFFDALLDFHFCLLLIVFEEASGEC